jgi:cytochrome b
MSSRTEKVFVWSRKVRIFHWLNVLSIVLLVAIGLVIFNSKALGISTDGKILLKELHVCVGYIFALNLTFRLVLGLIGKGFERFGKMLPFTKGYGQELKDYKNGAKTHFKGHNPAGKLMVAALLAAMSVQMVTGLVIAGTDIYYPPFGKYFAQSIAEDKTQLELIKPYSKENVNQQAFDEMRAFRKPFITMHVYAFYSLLFLIPLHILGVIVAERREQSSLTSAMIHGYKYLPEDKNNNI